VVRGEKRSNHQVVEYGCTEEIFISSNTISISNIDVWLVNRAHIKNVSGRKVDIHNKAIFLFPHFPRFPENQFSHSGKYQITQ
jgi:hypothetical protein